MTNNPFTSKSFETIWLKHFTESMEPIQFNGILNLSFIKSRNFPIFINIGKNWTKAMSYTINENTVHNKKNKIFLIYDVPNYILEPPEAKINPIKVLKIKQYDGFLAKLTAVDSLESYMQSQFDSKSRYKFRRNKKRLKECFNISETIYFGEISKKEYANIFISFDNLLRKAFIEKQVKTNITEKWEFYRELVYPMILEKKASLYVLRNEEEPICIALNFHSDSIAFLFFSVYDSDFSKFGIGYMSVMSCIKWCIDNKIEAYDFSKGYFHYKERWSNIKYHFNYHILYYSKNPKSFSIALILATYFTLKQKLREININKIYNKVKFFYYYRMEIITRNNGYEFGPEKELNPDYILKKLNINDSQYAFLRRPMCDFIYKTGEASNEIRVTEAEGSFWVLGSKHMQQIRTINNKIFE